MKKILFLMIILFGLDLFGVKQITSFPSMTTTERNALTSVPTGTIVLNTTTSQFERYNGATWDAMIGTATGANTTLSNLGTTDINSTFTFQASLNGIIKSKNDTTTSDMTATTGTASAGSSGVGSLRSGNGTTASGAVIVQTGSASGTGGTSGLVSLKSGNGGGTNSNTGNITLTSGDGTGSGTSGTITVSSGNSGTAGTTGDVNILTGTPTTGTRGTVHVKPELRFDGSTSGYVGIKATATPTSHTLTLPSAQGGASTVLTNDGSGVLSWAAAGARYAKITGVNGGNCTISSQGLGTWITSATYTAPTAMQCALVITGFASTPYCTCTPIGVNSESYQPSCWLDSTMSSTSINVMSSDIGGNHGWDFVLSCHVP